MHVLTLWSLLLLIAFGGYSQASESKEYIVGVEPIDYSPLWSIKNDQYSDFARELLDLFAAKNNIHFSFRPLPINRLWAEFVSGKVDFKFPDNPAWGSNIKSTIPVYYSQKVFNYVDGILVKKERLDVSFPQMKRIGIIRGFTPSDDIRYSDVEVLETSNMNQLFKLLMIERIDGIYSNILVGQHHLKNNAFPTNLVVYNPALPHINGSYVLSSVKHPALISEFSAFLQTHQSEVNQLKAKYSIPLE